MKNPNLDGKLDPLKPALSHIGLYLSLAAYTAIGAKVSPFLFLSIWRNVATRKSRNLPIAFSFYAKSKQIGKWFGMRYLFSAIWRL